jgi:hypothetical protein
MKNIKLFLFAFLTFTLMSATCETEPVEEECECKIEGEKQISTDGGLNWSYSGMDERTGLMFPCSFDGAITNQETDQNGTMYQTVWNCKD